MSLAGVDAKSIGVWIVGLQLLLGAFLHAEAQPEPDGVTRRVSDGQRVHSPAKGFSLTPPVGWQVVTGVPNVSLMMERPLRGSQDYPGSIQVLSFEDGHFIDEVTAESFAQRLAENFRRISPGSQSFRIRNQVLVEALDGRPGVLYYTEFDLNDRAIMQAILLVSGMARHYMLIYTDDADLFEKDAQPAYLDAAWEAMTSVELSTPTPQRYDWPKQLVGGLVAAFVFWQLVAFIRRRKAKHDYDEFADNAPVDEHGVTEHEFDKEESSVVDPLPEEVSPADGELGIEDEQDDQELDEELLEVDRTA